MFQLEEDDWPLVRLRFAGRLSAADEAAYLAALERLGQEGPPYVVLVVSDGESHVSEAGRRAAALWFKRARPVLARRCRSLVRVRQGGATRRGDAAAFAKAMPFPVADAGSEAEGVALARRLLAVDSD